MRRLLQTCLLFALTLAAVNGVDAQRRRGLADVTPDHARRGFWIAPVIGAGWESFKFDDDAFIESQAAPTIALRLGGTPSANLRIGGEVAVWVFENKEDPVVNVTETLASFMLIGQFYPMRDAGLFFKGGAGFGRTAATPEAGIGTSETGFAYTLGVGYDIPLGRRVWFTPTVDLSRHRFSQRNQPTLHERLLFVGIGVTFQPGR